jgi:hypothetical protein
LNPLDVIERQRNRKKKFCEMDINLTEEYFRTLPEFIHTYSTQGFYHSLCIPRYVVRIPFIHKTVILLVFHKEFPGTYIQGGSDKSGILNLLF